MASIYATRLKYLAVLFATVVTMVSEQSFAQGSNNQVIMRSSGGAYDQALKKYFTDPFTAATGIRVILVPTPYGEQLAKMKAMAESGRVEWDIALLQYDQVPQLAEYLVDMGDCSSVPNVASQGIEGTCARWGVMSAIASRVFVYNSSTIRNGPKTWVDFFDIKKFPQKRALPNDGTVWADLAAALIGDGVAPDNLFPLDVNRAFRKMDEIRPSVSAFWKTGDQSIQLLRDGEADMAIVFGSRAFAMKNQGMPIAWTFDQSIADISTFSPLKGAPNPQAALAFLNFYMTRPDAHASFVKELGFGTPNKFAVDLLPPDLKDNSLANPKTAKSLVHMDMAWVTANRSALIERWSKWITR